MVSKYIAILVVVAGSTGSMRTSPAAAQDAPPRDTTVVQPGDTVVVPTLPPVVPDTVVPPEPPVLPMASEPVVWLVSNDELDRARLAEMTGRSVLPRLLLRSPGILLRESASPRSRIRLLGPEVQFVNNSAIPWSMNDGAMWAGRGLNTRTSLGFAADFGRLHLVVAPEIVTSENRHFDLRVDWIERPPIPADRSEWQFEWYAYGPYSIDMPTRFGAESIQRVHPGQSSIAVELGPVEFGAGSENNWWGPGIRNALVLSNNAPGFPHLFFRMARPLQTRWGALDFRWLVGGLSESDFFDTVSTNDLRSISAGAATLQLRRPAGITLGVARSVWGTASGWGGIAGRWFDVFRATGRPNDTSFGDSTLYPGGRDQVYSVFGRWVMPRAGVETWFEWGRTEFPASLRDAFTSPGHTQAYTLGLQWARKAFRDSDLMRLQVENTSVERSASFRERPVGVWYTSRRVIQGYTNRGQPLGAAVGPGSSGQTVALDYVRPTASFGLLAGRIRYNEDVRTISHFPLFKSWCTHDVYLYGGLRASARSRLGLVELEVIPANRIQAWFQVGSGCPRGDAMVDIRNTTLRLTFKR